MIHVYTDSSDYTKEGNAVIMPLSGTVRKVAAGAYELNFTAPMDAEGKWAYLIPEAVVKAPVPREVIKTATTGINVDIYKTTAATAMRSGTSEPTTITYTSWSSTADYAVGTRVSWNGSNYRCKYYDETSAYAHVAPPNNPGWWAKIARTTEGSPVLVNLKSGKELIYISGPSSGWYKMETKDGIQGYVKSSDITFYEHRSASQNQPREITTQLFRIKEVTYMETDRQVSVYATHVSYDLNAIMVAGVKIVRKNPATTLAKIEDGLMTSYAGDIYTDWGTSNSKKYTGEINGKSGMFALLDPDKGVVAAFDAEFRRDNWDVFVLKKTTHNNGFELRVGKNVKGITWKRSTNNGFYLRIVPVAKNKEGENLFLSPTHWLNSSQISSYPVPYMEWLKVEGQVGRDDGNDDGTDWTNTTLREEMERQYLRLLQNSLEGDIRYGYTAKGIHRDDLEILINSFTAKGIASQGQQRSAVLALKLAEGEISREMTGKDPVYLLDDVLSELDETRRAYITMGLVGKQVILSGTDEENFAFVDQKIRVLGGEFQG